MWHVGEHIDRFSKACLGHNAYPGLSLMLTMINTARWARISPGVTHCHSGSTKPFPSCFCATYLLVSCDWRKVWGTKKKKYNAAAKFTSRAEIHFFVVYHISVCTTGWSLYTDTIEPVRRYEEIHMVWDRPIPDLNHQPLDHESDALLTATGSHYTHV